ncbi:KPN_02809 family neutral zinc metallopeptidase [Tsukamurella sp. USMM236]|uniref:KPN_02809 family neutral zinc metallopeptidase n=1 Tax=Tsukamurella sp. USMM236 TaxID=3081301 RepID=UPI003017EDCC
MTFRDDSDLSGGNVSAGGGGGLGRGMVIGGGSIGTVVIGLIIYFLTGSTGGVPQQSQQGQGSGQGISAGQEQVNRDLAACKTGADANKNTTCRIKATTISLDKVWPTVLRGYQPPRGGTKIMPSDAQSINTACGVASADTGPFYCPSDQVAVFQLDFMDRVIKKMGGTNAPFSQEYIVAHEFGHHVQTLLGDINKAQQGRGAQGGSVRVELQADCYAGVWAAHADKGDDAILKPLTQEEISEAITTAQAIGDDTIQRNAGRNVNPESFSHGTSEQRVRWFSQGYRTGAPAQCDTFSGNI